MLTNVDAANAPEAPPAAEDRTLPRKPRRKADAAPPTPSLTRLQRLYAPVRRALDFTGALTLLVVLSPLLALAALAVRLTSRGPAFYTQVRTGRGGRPFTIYK